MSSKYFSGFYAIEWVRSHVKHSQNGSICWKAFVEAFLLISKHLAWEIGNISQVKIGEDPWVGSRGSFKFPEHLISNLHDNGIFALRDVALVSMDRARRT